MDSMEASLDGLSGFVTADADEPEGTYSSLGGSGGDATQNGWTWADHDLVVLDTASVHCTAQLQHSVRRSDAASDGITRFIEGVETRGVPASVHGIAVPGGASTGCRPSVRRSLARTAAGSCSSIELWQPSAESDLADLYLDSSSS